MSFRDRSLATAARNFSIEKSFDWQSAINSCSRGDDFRRRQRNLAGNFEWNGLDAMQIAVQQIAGLDFQPADFHRRAEFHNVNVGVRNGNAAGKEMKAQFFGRRQIAHGTVRHGPHATERAQNVDMHRAQQRAETDLRGHILHHHHPRRRQRKNIFPPIGAVGIRAGGRGRRRTTNFDRGGVAQHRRQVGKQATQEYGPQSLRCGAVL